MRAGWLICTAWFAACGRVGFEETGREPAACDVPGALGYWPLDQGDLAGAQVLDRSGNARHGTLQGTPPPVAAPGRHGDALDYAATDVGFVALPTLPVDPAPGAVTSVAMWFFHSTTNVDETLIYLPSGGGTQAPRYDLWLSDALPTPSLCINTGFGDCWGITDASLTERWVHVVANFVNGATIGGSLFVDGAAVTMACRFGTCDQARVVQPPFTLGADDARYAWHGLLDDIRIYDRALSAEEAATLHACTP